jgi:hypothetical protein
MLIDKAGKIYIEKEVRNYKERRENEHGRKNK